MNANPQASSLTHNFRVWDFSTVDGGGYAVVRAPWCAIAERTDAIAQGALMPAGWHGTEFTVRAWSTAGAEKAYRQRYTVQVDLRRCGCGCLTMVS